MGPSGISVQRDGAVLFLLLLLIVMLVAALVGSPGVFASSMITTLGLFMGLAFVRRSDPVTWIPPIAATLVLAASMIGLFLYQDAPVRSVGDTVGGFQAGTAFLIYGVWIPAFFTLGVGFAVVFDRLEDPDRRDVEQGQ